MKQSFVAKVVLVLDMFLHENNYNYDPYKFSYKSAFILFLSFLRTKKRTEVSPSWWPDYEKYFHFLFKMSCALLQIHVNSIPFYNGIFLHVIPVHIIVPCTNCTLTEAFVQNFLRKKVALKNSGKIWGCPCLYRYELEINRSV